jgi:hypothetical protein
MEKQNKITTTPPGWPDSIAKRSHNQVFVIITTKLLPLEKGVIGAISVIFTKTTQSKQSPKIEVGRAQA